MWNTIKASFPWSSGRGSAAGRAILRVASGETHSSSPSADVNCKKIKSGQYVLSRRADFVWAPVRIQGLVDTNIPELTATPADRLGERWCDSEYQCINLLVFPIAACAVSAATSIRGLLMSSTGSRSVGAFRYLMWQAECQSVTPGIRLKSNGWSAEKERGEPGSAPNNPMRGSSRISGSQGLSAGQMLTTGQGD